MPEMDSRKLVVILPALLWAGTGFALQSDEILIVANKDVAESVQLARYYCQKRQVPTENVLALPLGEQLRDTISRNDYEKFLAEPTRERLLSDAATGKVKCLLTTYGVPYRVGERGPLKAEQGRLKELQELAQKEKEKFQQLEQGGKSGSIEYRRSKRELEQLQSDIDRIDGRETGASVDSELSMVLSGSYELYRWQPNMLKDNMLGLSVSTLMVSRLDGPSYTIARGLVDKAVRAEQTGLRGTAYVDSRGLNTRDAPGYVDRSLRTMAMRIRLQSRLAIREERTDQLFAPGSCPNTVIYCGWYSLKKYVDAFDFVEGAVGYHIASFEAVNLRDPNSSQWCPAMLTDGITATLGAVAEPYLHSFPMPAAFFSELSGGSCLVEAFYRSKPFNSWQLVLIGDPLYRPFKGS